MIATIAADLDVAAETVWAAVKRVDTFLYVTRGALGLSVTGGLPVEFRRGQDIRGRLLLFGVVPVWQHDLHLVRVDDARRELYSNECGGPLRAWNHRITVEPTGADRCRYTDVVEIDAGLLTPLVWVVAQGFFRYRQSRLRRLLRAGAMRRG